MNQPDKTIAQVIEELNEIIKKCIEEESPLGYFATLYRNVTVRISQGILQNEFDDNDRMERLDVIFAQRYIDAYNCYKSGAACTQSWKIAFMAAEKNEVLILQHLLLGINAHINLDLGVAAALTSDGAKIQSLKNDFNKINFILADMVDDVQHRIGKASPVFGILDPLTKNLDEKLVNFSIEKARDGAWKFANEFFIANDAERAKCVNNRDYIIARLAQNLASPGSGWLRAVINFIRFFAKKKPSEVIAILD